MRLASLLYHDVVPDGAFGTSGYTGAGADVYKMDDVAFRKHLDAIAAATQTRPARITDVNSINTGCPILWLLTFDDGGASARMIGELLAERGWVGHFFITGDRIGTPGFVDVGDLRALAALGHVIGAHSWSHPLRISALPAAEIHAEWQKCLERLADIIGLEITTASVPGGFYSSDVGQEAMRAGVRVLFNSEPVLRPRAVDGGLVLGRFSIQRDTPARTAAAFASGRLTARLPQWLAWNTRKAAKRVVGFGYESIREGILERKGR